ncbi:MAG: metal-sensitive transcriptional regulator [Candidatus Peribacteria bacterium]|jgi:DNA-binding FrmR family transcriptional regulator|nr:metal-sensitive transcriptional regulator [Candidatus Peribacteria bacterium]
MKDCCTPTPKGNVSARRVPHSKALIAIKKSKSLLDKIGKMIEDGAYCADISQQVNAVIGMMQSLNSSILQDHLMSCGVRELSSHDQKQVETFVEELVRVRGISNRK